MERKTIYEEINATLDKITDPIIVKDASMKSGQNVTYSCIWFGSYPQTEVVAVNDYAALKPSHLQKGDVIVDSNLYNQLQSAVYNSNNETIIDGCVYRRMLRTDAVCSFEYSSYYRWSDNTTYHYFKYEPIKWRVIHKVGSMLFLLADKVLDAKLFDSEKGAGWWNTSEMRSWLNGYESAFNYEGIDYSNHNFIVFAFNSLERASICKIRNRAGINGPYSEDKVFLLDDTEVISPNYGFVRSNVIDEARKCKSSTYAKAMGVNTEFEDKCNWWLRSPGDFSSEERLVCDYGGIRSTPVAYKGGGCRPALKIDLSISKCVYAGTICTDGTMREENKYDT